MKALLFSLALAVPSSLFAQSREASIGCWTMASRAGESLQLNRDGRFNFNDYNTKKGAFDYMSGTWTYASNGITLLYDDRPKQTFTLRKEKSGKWILTKAGGFLFRKADPSACAPQYD